MEVQIFGTNQAKEIQTRCLEQYDESDSEGRILCLCHGVNSEEYASDCGGFKKTGCCMKMTMMAFRSPGVKPWACAKTREGSCEPMYPGGGKKISPRKPKEAEKKPEVRVVEERVDDNNMKDEDELLDDLDDLEEEEELDLDDDDDIPNSKDGKDEDGDHKEETADDDAGKIGHCDKIEDAAKHALCICGIADTEEKCGKLSDNCKDPWSCAVNPVSRTCGPIQPVAPQPTQKPKPKEEEKPQPKDCTGNVEDSEWWKAHQAYYSKLFKVGEHSAKYGGSGAVLKCKYTSKSHDCLKGSYTKTSGIQSIIEVQKKKGVSIQCGFDGQWKEPSNVERQSCAYPIVPKNLQRKDEKGQIIDAGEKLNRVLTVVDEGGKKRVRAVKWTDGYNLNQLFVIDHSGLIRAIGTESKCLSGMDEDNLFFTKSGWLEGYLQLHECEKNGGVDDEQIWWLGPDMADFLRREEKAGTCSIPNSCCSLTYALTSKGMSRAAGGKDYLTYPQIEEQVTDVGFKEYFWRKDGSVDFYSPYKVGSWVVKDHYTSVGMRAKGGVVIKPSGGEADKRLTQSFYVVAENKPKVLKFVKMSMLDTMLTVVDFWKV